MDPHASEGLSAITNGFADATTTHQPSSSGPPAAVDSSAPPVLPTPVLGPPPPPPSAPATRNHAGPPRVLGQRTAPATTVGAGGVPVRPHRMVRHAHFSSQNTFDPAATVHVYNVPLRVTDGYLLDLCSRWGTVASVARQPSRSSTGSAEATVVYSSRHEAQEALRHLDGGTLHGAILRAQLKSVMLARHLESFSKPLSTQDQANQAAGGPRNLYVLNLSLEMTTEELERLFSVFGEVVHVCIMAVLDQVGKRRAFVDMATGEAARQAISGLSGTYIHGYKIDVSFAIVQRSGGPVTDYPPTPRKRLQQASLHLSKNPEAGASAYVRQQLHYQIEGSNRAITPSDGALVPYSHSPPQYSSMQFPSGLPMHAYGGLPYEHTFPMQAAPLMHSDLYVTNLDPVAIVDSEDLSAMFKPFGTVIFAHLFVSPSGLPSGAGLVKMSNPGEAEFARSQLQGRVSDGKILQVNFGSSPIPHGYAAFNAMASPVYTSPTMTYAASSGTTSPMLSPQMLSSPSSYPAGLHSGLIFGGGAPMYHGSTSAVSFYPMAGLAASMAGLGIYEPAQSTQTSTMHEIENEPAESIPQSRRPAFSKAEEVADTSLGESSRSVETANHSREPSVETTSTSIPSHAGSILDVKVEEDFPLSPDVVSPQAPSATQSGGRVRSITTEVLMRETGSPAQEDQSSMTTLKVPRPRGHSRSYSDT